MNKKRYPQRGKLFNVRTAKNNVSKIIIINLLGIQSVILRFYRSRPPNVLKTAAVYCTNIIILLKVPWYILQYICSSMITILLQLLSADRGHIDRTRYVCMYGHHIYSRVWINRVRLPILLVVS